VEGQGPAPTAGQQPESGTAEESIEHTFVADLWIWDARRQDTWTFVTVPPETSRALEDLAEARGPRAGFGSIRVEVRVGPSTWRTSVFPDSGSGCFVLPIKKSVRVANGVGVGDAITVALRVA
jgi:hypothetical protein